MHESPCKDGSQFTDYSNYTLVAKLNSQRLTFYELSLSDGIAIYFLNFVGLRSVAVLTKLWRPQCHFLG